MTEAELRMARDLVEDMEDCARKSLYFGICGEDSSLLSRYIRELEQSLTRHARYEPDVMALLPP